MAHWFHRNPLKSTVPLKFEGLKKIAKGPKCDEILTELKTSRSVLLELLNRPTNKVDEVTVAFTKYLGLLRGLVEAPDGKESKLRKVVMFKWTNSLGGRIPTIQTDAWFEIISIVMNMAIWHSKHAAELASSDTIDLEQAKEVHRSLKIAGGMFLNVKDVLLPKLPPSPDKGTDTDTRVVEAYVLQSQAEAQEVTLARALEMGHKPSIVLALATETAKTFIDACTALKTLDPVTMAKWSTYLTLKAKFYEALAYCYLGQDLLAKEKCGESIKVLQTSQQLSQKAIELCEKYARVKGPGTIARPERHPFFQKLAPMIKLHLDKSVRENGFIYHQKVPEECPELERPPQTYGLATPQDFTLPPHSPLWTEETFAAFQASGETDGAYETKSAAAHEEIAPVPEPDVAPGKDKESHPQTTSGCTVS